MEFKGDYCGELSTLYNTSSDFSAEHRVEIKGCEVHFLYLQYLALTVCVFCTAQRNCRLKQKGKHLVLIIAK